jgi:CBS domain-containing protein
MTPPFFSTGCLRASGLEILVPQYPIRCMVGETAGDVRHFSKGRSPMKVKEAMHKGVEWVGPDTPVTELAKLMRDMGAIPIGESDRLIGMVTDRDIVCKGLAEDSFDA